MAGLGGVARDAAARGAHEYRDTRRTPSWPRSARRRRRRRRRRQMPVGSVWSTTVSARRRNEPNPTEPNLHPTEPHPASPSRRRLLWVGRRSRSRRFDADPAGRGAGRRRKRQRRPARSAVARRVLVRLRAPGRLGRRLGRRRERLPAARVCAGRTTRRRSRTRWRFAPPRSRRRGARLARERDLKALAAHVKDDGADRKPDARKPDARKPFARRRRGRFRVGRCVGRRPEVGAQARRSWGRATTPRRSFATGRRTRFAATALARLCAPRAPSAWRAASPRSTRRRPGRTRGRPVATKCPKKPPKKKPRVSRRAPRRRRPTRGPRPARLSGPGSRARRPRPRTGVLRTSGGRARGRAGRGPCRTPSRGARCSASPARAAAGFVRRGRGGPLVILGHLRVRSARWRTPAPPRGGGAAGAVAERAPGASPALLRAADRGAEGGGGLARRPGGGAAARRGDHRHRLRRRRRRRRTRREGEATPEPTPPSVAAAAAVALRDAAAAPPAGAIAPRRAPVLLRPSERRDRGRGGYGGGGRGGEPRLCRSFDPPLGAVAVLAACLLESALALWRRTRTAPGAHAARARAPAPRRASPRGSSTRPTARRRSRAQDEDGDARGVFDDDAPGDSRAKESRLRRGGHYWDAPRGGFASPPKLDERRRGGEPVERHSAAGLTEKRATTAARRGADAPAASPEARVVSLDDLLGQRRGEEGSRPRGRGGGGGGGGGGEAEGR